MHIQPQPNLAVTIMMMLKFSYYAVYKRENFIRIPIMCKKSLPYHDVKQFLHFSYSK